MKSVEALWKILLARDGTIRRQQKRVATVEASLQAARRQAESCAKQQQTYIDELERACAERLAAIQVLDAEVNRLRTELKRWAASPLKQILRSWREKP